MKVFSHVATKRPWFRSVIAELLSDESRVATSGEAAARRGNTLGSLEFGRRAEESADSQQPVVLSLGSLWWQREIEMEHIFILERR